jgi:prepilin-type N-terminal cleavage/methylation domain-containing protein
MKKNTLFLSRAESVGVHCRRDSRRGSRASAAGFSLIELVVAMTVILIMFPSGMNVFSHILQTKYLNEYRIVSVNLAQGVVEHLSQRRYMWAHTMARTGFDDLTISGSSEANPFYDPDFDDFDFEVQVTCVEDNGTDIDGWPETDVCVRQSDTTGYKRVLVRVYYGANAGHGGEMVISQTTLLADTRDDT